MRPSILIVEPEAVVADLLRLVCEQLLCDVVPVRTADEARLALLRGPLPTLLVLDLDVGDGSLQFCREVKTTWPVVRVLVLSSDVRPATHAEAQAAGADHFVPKPFDPEALVGTVEHLVRSAA